MLQCYGWHDVLTDLELYHTSNDEKITTSTCTNRMKNHLASKLTSVGIIIAFNASVYCYIVCR